MEKQNGIECGEYTDNQLMLYILQCRSADFVSCFEAQNNRCYMGVYSLYQLAWANYMNLSSEDWSPSFMKVIEPCRIECREIMDYLKTVITIPQSLDDMRNFLRHFAYYGNDESLQDMVDCSLSELTAMGYRAIDCELYEAGMKLDYDNVERFLTSGASPDVCISGHLSPFETAETECTAVSCLSVDVNVIVCNTVDLYGIDDYWRAGLKREPQLIRLSDIPVLFRGAAYKLMEEIISPNHGIIMTVDRE